MRRLGWAPTSVLAIVLMAGPLQAQKKISAAYSVTPNVSVRLFAAVGTVQVVGWERDSVEISGTVPSDTRSPLMTPSPRRLEGLKFFLEAATEQEGREGTITLRVPRGARVWVKTGSAHIAVSDVDGGLDLNVVGGSIDVRGSPRELRAESMDGAVTVDGAPQWVRVKTATGDIVLRGGGQNVGASTISGTIDAREGQTERATLETTTGPIRFALAVARGASIELETHSGAIDVQLSRKSEVEMDAATVTGTIESTWSRARPAAGREGRGMTLVTAGGPSSGRMVVRSFKGRISLRGS